jgi:uncharacterized membrane protein
MSALRKWLFTGLLVIVPGVITAWVLNWIIGTLDQTLAILPAHGSPTLLGMHIPGFGVLLTLPSCCSWARGQQFSAASWCVGDAGARIPVVRSIYSSVKQVSDTLFSDSGNAFARRCWCSGRARASGPWPSSPASPAAKWRLPAR